MFSSKTNVIFDMFRLSSTEVLSICLALAQKVCFVEMVSINAHACLLSVLNESTPKNHLRCTCDFLFSICS